MPRDYTPREMRLVAEWATQTYPAAEIRFRVSVGDLSTQMEATGLSVSELRALGTARRWVDCLVIEPRTVHLIEAKIRLQPGALEQLALYAMLFPLTPELEAFRDRELEQHLVYAVEDLALVALARSRGVKVHIYHPPWVDEYLAMLRARETRGSQPRGLETLLPPGGKSEGT